MSAPVPDRILPPYEGFTAEDFLAMSELSPHSELIDGSLVFGSPQSFWHSEIIDLIKRSINGVVRPDWRAARELSVKLGDRQVPEPDVAVVPAELLPRNRRVTHLAAADVLLAVEVVSPESQSRDRETKPGKYAAAGIPHFWRVEPGADGGGVAYTYERDPAGGCYGLTGIHHGRLTTAAPFALDFGISADDIWD